MHSPLYGAGSQGTVKSRLKEMGVLLCNVMLEGLPFDPSEAEDVEFLDKERTPA